VEFTTILIYSTLSLKRIKNLLNPTSTSLTTLKWQNCHHGFWESNLTRLRWILKVSECKRLMTRSEANLVTDCLCRKVMTMLSLKLSESDLKDLTKRTSSLSTNLLRKLKMDFLMNLHWEDFLKSKRFTRESTTKSSMMKRQESWVRRTTRTGLLKQMDAHLRKY